MGRRSFLLWPDPRLRAVAAPVTTIDAELRALWAEMVEAMEAMPGYGLAAPQIGLPKRLAVVDCSSQRGQAVLMANPEILHTSERLREHEEASPNLPGVSAVVARPRAVTVRFINAAGAAEERDFVDLWAISVQHQIDHLNGRMYFDRLSPVKRKMLLARARKVARRQGA